MTEDLNRGVSITTPVGVFQWPSLQVPRPNFAKDGLEYTCNLLLTPEDAKPLINRLEGLFQDNLAQVAKENPKLKSIKAADKPWKEDTDKEGVPTGFIVFKTKRKAEGVSKASGKPWQFRVKLFNADCSPFTQEAQIGSGTKGRLIINVRGYYVRGEAGLTLSLEGAQISKLVQAGKVTAQDFGLSALEIPEDDKPEYDS